MANVHDMYIFSAEQIEVPDAFPGILKNFVKEVVRNQPNQQQIATFCRQYFENLLNNRGAFVPPERERIEVAQKDFYLKRKENIKDHYDLHEVIGEGELSRVRRATHKGSSIQRAVKVVRKEDLEFGERKGLFDEIELLRELDHPNIGKVIEMFEDSKKLYFVNEMMYGGTIFQRLQRDKHFSEAKAAKIIKQLVSAVAYLHAQGIVHGDIKPHNIHFRSADDDVIKLIDFGTTRKINADHEMHGVYGTSYFMAPEVIERNYSEKCDVWSCGVILYMLISGKPPFDGRDDKEVVKNISNGKFELDSDIWSIMSPELKDLVSKMLVRESKRLSAKEVLQHPWFAIMAKLEGTEESKAKQLLIHKALFNLQSFSTRNKLKQAALGFLIQHFMHMSDSEDLEQVFQALDTSGEGFLTKEELIAGYRKYYGHDFNEQEIEALLHMADQSEDGRIGYSEFVMTCIDREKFMTLEKLEALFSELDTDGNHKISFQEIKQILGSADERISLEALQEAFMEVDTNRKGEITFPQFRQFIQNLL